MTAIQQAVKALKSLEADRQSIGGLQAQIRQTEADMISLTEMGYGYGTERMKVLQDDKRGLEARERAVTCRVKQADAVLAALGDDPKDVLITFFCKGLKPAVARIRLERKLNVSRSEVYRIRERALQEFAHRMGYVGE